MSEPKVQSLVQKQSKPLDSNSTSKPAEKQNVPHVVDQKTEGETTDADIDKQEFKEIADLIAQCNWSEARERLSAITDNTTMMYITDAGGQPEFFDIIPLVVRGPSLCLVFLNLALSLTESFEVTYRHEQSTGKQVEYQSSTLNLICYNRFWLHWNHSNRKQLHSLLEHMWIKLKRNYSILLQNSKI